MVSRTGTDLVELASCQWLMVSRTGTDLVELASCQWLMVELASCQ
ncbi:MULTISPECIES: hypothetical protein [unclassified Moorena]|nr:MULTISPECIES: hypothetical protein [unclassified Moorena]